MRFGRQHVRDGVGALKTEKSGFTVVVTLPILPVLAETLAAGPCGDLTFIVGEIGQPLTKESFGNLFRAACKTAGVPGSAHGVRKIAATRAANAGRQSRSWRQSSAGPAALWRRTTRSPPIASVLPSRRCTSSRKNDDRTSIPSPFQKVRASERKTKRNQRRFSGVVRSRAPDTSRTLCRWTTGLATRRRCKTVSQLPAPVAPVASQAEYANPTDYRAPNNAM